MKSGNRNFLDPSGPLQACNGTALPLWMLVYPVGYVGVGFEGNCDCRYGILYAPMLGGGYVGYSDIFS